jgi:hypothetical protein
MVLSGVDAWIAVTPALVVAYGLYRLSGRRLSGLMDRLDRWADERDSHDEDAYEDAFAAAVQREHNIAAAQRRIASEVVDLDEVRGKRRGRG